MTQTTSLAVAVNITRQFIDEHPLEVVMGRRNRTPTSAGGWTLGSPVDQLKQTIRLISGRMYVDTVRTTAEGRQVHPTHTLVALFGANIEKFDVFSIGGDDFEVVWVEDKELFGRKVGEVWKNG